MTMTEKILAAASGKSAVKPGEKVKIKVDLAMIHDVTGDPACQEFLKRNGENAKVWDKNKIVVVPDHFIPNKDIPSAKLYQGLCKFSIDQGLPHFYPLGENYGVCHVMLPQEGYDLPGTVIVGADSHTCTHGAFGLFSMGIGSTEMANVFATGEIELPVPPTMQFVINGKLPANVMAKDLILQIIGDVGVKGATFQAMEFTGSTIKNMSMDERMTLTNMVVEAGATNGIIAADDVALRYLGGRKPKAMVTNDSDAEFSAVYEYDASKIVPTVAKPFLPSNTSPAAELSNVKIDQAVIASCTGGKMEDIRAAARILKGKKVAKGVRLIVIPSTQKVYRQALKEGLFEIFLDAGAVISAPTCGPCLGGHMGVLAPGEKCISSTNRNFAGRMGDKTSEVYLASPITVAASAIAGHITPAPLQGGAEQKIPSGKPYVVKYKREIHIEEDIPAIPEKTLQRTLKGKAFAVGDDIDTDVIIPARYLNTADPGVLKLHAMEDLDRSKYPKPFINSDGSCDYRVVIGGNNFGCGSSREHAPIALYHAGAQAVVAVSFARIFVRNAIKGETILPLESETDLSKEIKTGDEVEIDTKEWNLIDRTSGKMYPLKKPRKE